MTKNLWVVLAVTLLAAAAFGQGLNQQAAAGFVNPASTTCLSTYSSGSGPTFFQWCVTSNGNIVSIQSPQDEEHIFEGTVGEGYQICDQNVSYRDYAGYGDSGNWKTSVVTQPNGPNTFPLTIKRTTSDGKYVLTQKFNQVPANFTVTIAMTVKNNTTSPVALNVYRFADLDIDQAGSFAEDWFDQGANAAWGYLPFADGIMLSTSTNTTAFHFASVTKAVPSDCSFPSATTPAHIDGGVYLVHEISLAARASTTFNLSYRRF
jgi:hypothetical protein